MIIRNAYVHIKFFKSILLSFLCCSLDFSFKKVCEFAAAADDKLQGILNRGSHMMHSSSTEGAFDTPVHATMSLLPAIALKMIADYLPLRDKMTLTKVSHQWRSFMLNSSYLWRKISIDWSSPFSDNWKMINQGNLYKIFYQDDSKREEYVSTMERFILQLANVTDMIEN